jgi:heme exporter protein C
MTRRLTLLTAAGVAATAGAVAMIFGYAPTDDLQGVVQRIFYVHVSSAIVAYTCFALVLAGSVNYLWREGVAGDRLARAAAPVGLLFTTVTLVMGSLWAKPIWGAYWVWWDPRLMSTLALWSVYGGYLLVRRLAAPGRSEARLAAVVGIVGFFDVPVVHFSVTWWRTTHPQPILAASGGPHLPAEMLLTFLVALGALLLLGMALVGVRYRLETLADRLAEVRFADLEEPAPARPAVSAR